MATLTVSVPEGSTQNITGVVTIDAPLEQVFAAHTNIEQFSQWFLRGNKVRVHHFNAISGGAWHLDELGDNGESFGFTGCYHEVALNERIIWTFEFLGMPERGHVLLERMDFKPVGNKTEIHVLTTFQSQADRDGMIASGMETGWRECITALSPMLERKS